MTALDIITSAMTRINAIAPGESPTAAEANTGFTDLNDLIDSWQIERLMIYTVNRQEFPLTVLKQVYTCGPGGDFNIPRPSNIDRMSIMSLANPAQPLELPLEYLTDAQWAMIPVKQIASSLPQSVWDDQGYPLRSLSFWCIPNVPVNAVIYSWGVLGSFADLVTDYTFPPGYADAIKYNLAYRLAGEYGPYMPPALPGLALESKARVKSLNHPLIDLRCDDALVGTGKRTYNWITDSPIGSR